MATPNYEKLAAFYLGKQYDLEEAAITDDILLYDAKDLTTHAVCVGMTGSGKTGLCLSLIEEAAIDGIPTIAIDPKGDLGNLLLAFPKLQPSEFRPWIDEAEAARKGMTPDEYAADRAGLWKKGLKDWDQDGARIGRFKDAADVNIYTPGSNTGMPLMILRSLKAPPESLIDDNDAMRERLMAVVSGLLALLGIDADPIQSREHILISNIVDRSWRAGRDLDVASLIQSIQTPPFERLGVMDVESFFPSKDRFKLAMSLNNLLASPGFAAWMTGDPLDINRLLYTTEGKPRVSILSIAHLSDAERMFFVTILLNEIVAWVRSQPGTGSLRAILYMDEIFGYFPPTANPPSKMPMLTLLKQARAYGLGVMLATQNPVDLDYKGLANTGTWFIGRLQTERDKLRLLDGLESANASSKMNRSQTEKVLSSLGSRVFLMNNVHEDAPTLFRTRWALSYLRGPLTRSQIQKLMEPRKALAAQNASVPSTPNAKQPRNTQQASLAASDPGLMSYPPPLPPGVNQVFLPTTRNVPDGGYLRYEPLVVGKGKLHFVRVSAKVDDWRDVSLLAMLDGESGSNIWEAADAAKTVDIEMSGEPDARYAPLPAIAQRKTSYSKWSKSLTNYLYRNHDKTILKSKELKQYSELDESESDFRVRLRHLLHEKRDQQIEKLRKKYAPKLTSLEERIRKAEERVEREMSQMKQKGVQTAVSLGATILGALFGRKKASVGNVGRAASTIRSASRTAKERGDISRASDNVEALQKRLAEMEATFGTEIEEIRTEADIDNLEFEELTIRPRKSDIAIDTLALAWTPYVVRPDGVAEAAFDMG
ncbi:MAG: ATP-binding protein [Phycisphaerae bacterium]|nr:MAG: ATP-binding protein [Phycisphaerae bacterium]